MTGATIVTIGVNIVKDGMITVAPRAVRIASLTSMRFTLLDLRHLLILSAFDPHSDRYGYEPRSDRDRRDY